MDVSESDRVVLEKRVAAATTERRDWQRATIVLMAAAMSSPKIADAVGVNRNQVDLWKRRYVADGLDGVRSGDRRS